MIKWLAAGHDFAVGVRKNSRGDIVRFEVNNPTVVRQVYKALKQAREANDA